MFVRIWDLFLYGLTISFALIGALAVLEAPLNINNFTQSMAVVYLVMVVLSLIYYRYITYEFDNLELSNLERENL